MTGHSFVADANYASAVGRESTRVVSCNTTSIVRTLTALKRGGLLERARGTLLRRATDPWESHLGGIMNTLVPETSIPSHQAPDGRRPRRRRAGGGHWRRDFHTGRELTTRADASMTARARFGLVAALAGVYGLCYPLIKLGRDRAGGAGEGRRVREAVLIRSSP